MDCVAINEFVELVISSHHIPKDIILEITYAPTNKPDQVVRLQIPPNGDSFCTFGPHECCDININVNGKVFKFVKFSKQTVCGCRYEKLQLT